MKSDTSTPWTGTYVDGFGASWVFEAGLLMGPPLGGVGGCTICGVAVSGVGGNVAGPLQYAPAGPGGVPAASVYVANVPGPDVVQIPPAKDTGQ